MSGQPKRARILAALDRRAKSELGAEATVLEYICDAVANGQTIQALANSLAAELGESCSRNFLSGVANNLTPDARELIEAARREGAHALVDRTISVAEGAPETPGGVQKARLLIGSLQWIAERNNRQGYGNTKNEISISFGQAHLAALRRLNAQRAEARVITDTSEADADVVE